MRDHVKWLRDFARENTQGDVISAATALELADEIERLQKVESSYFDLRTACRSAASSG